MDPNCPFCRIVHGQIPSKKIYEDDVMLAVLDINPATNGHVLVMPKEHYYILPQVPGSDFLHIMRTTRQLSAALRDSLFADGITLFMANGGVAGQQSPHFLFHLIPRNKGDGLRQFDLPTREITDPQIDAIQKNLISVLQKLAAQFYQKSQLTVPEELLKQNKPTLQQLAHMVSQNPQLKTMILEQRLQFNQLVTTHPQLKELFEGVDIDELIRLL
jgi:histidine triad (HIT) family protein